MIMHLLEFVGAWADDDPVVLVEVLLAFHRRVRNRRECIHELSSAVHQIFCRGTKRNTSLSVSEAILLTAIMVLFVVFGGGVDGRTDRWTEYTYLHWQGRLSLTER